MNYRRIQSISYFLIGLLALSAETHARGKKDKATEEEPQDAIEVLGHVPLTGASITRFLTTQHYSSYYLYVEHEGGKTVTLIDVTKASGPVVVADVAYPAGQQSSSLFAVAGTAALVTESQAGPAASSPAQTVHLMDLSDPQHPAVTREFRGVTAMTKDEQRGLIFVAASDGIWILHQSLAFDPEMLKQWLRQVSAP
jgi:hypothetical protein